MSRRPPFPQAIRSFVGVHMRRLAVVLASLAVAPVGVLGLWPAAAAGQVAVGYRPPVDAPVVDPFHVGPRDWNAGNRGLEYATEPGSPVAASAPGEVVFAGPVAGGLHVVVLHADGLRTSYSFLRTISVHRGDRVRQGQRVGTAADRFHFGARAGEAYLDPAKLFGDGPPEVYLVPDGLRRPGTEDDERAGLARLLQAVGGRVVAGGAQAVGWARDRAVAAAADQLDELRGAVALAVDGQPITHLVRLAGAIEDWSRLRRTCTPEAVRAPRLQERHLAVLVAGLGSTSGHASVDDVDTGALGFAPTDVVRFAYNGGTTAEHSYSAADSTADMRRSARLLGELLERLQAGHPGVPIDVIAHSQGGIVARLALTDEAEAGDPRFPAVASLVTLGTPHQGAPLATALAMADRSLTGSSIETAAHAALPQFVDPEAASVVQLAEGSELLRELSRRPLPTGIKATSIGAREDIVVPAGTTRLDRADNVIVSVPGHGNEHAELPGSAEAQREIALGLAGLGPTCQRLGDVLADAVVSDVIRGAETTGAAAAWAGGRLADGGLGEPRTPWHPRRYH